MQMNAVLNCVPFSPNIVHWYARDVPASSSRILANTRSPQLSTSQPQSEFDSVFIVFPFTVQNKT